MTALICAKICLQIGIVKEKYNAYKYTLKIWKEVKGIIKATCVDYLNYDRYLLLKLKMYRNILNRIRCKKFFIKFKNI